MDLKLLLGPCWAAPALGVLGAMTCENWNAGMQRATAAAGMCGLQMSPASLESSSLRCTLAVSQGAALIAVQRLDSCPDIHSLWGCTLSNGCQ